MKGAEDWMIAELLGELRAAGIELRLEGDRLRVFGSRTGYSAALRAKLLAFKPEIVARLRGEAESTRTTYERQERAWSSEQVASLARARGYGDELARLAAAIVEKQHAGAPFSVGANVIAISAGEGREIRLHRLPQSWAR
jgi:TubC N-terminal docking domain